MDIFDSYNATNTLTSLQEKQNELYKTNIKYLYLILLLYIGVVLFLLIFILKGILITQITLVVSIFVVFVLGLVIYKAIINYRFVHKVLNQSVLDRYNAEQSTNIEYQFKPKVKGTYNKNMGLFTRVSSNTTRYRFNYSDGTQVMRTTIQTNTGRSNQIHFKGMYCIFKQQADAVYQIRTHGKPHFKEHKFIKTEQDNIKIFKEKELDYIKIDYNQIVTLLSEHKKKYIASNKEEIHIAFTPFKTKTKIKKIDYDTFNSYYLEMKNLLDKVTRLKEIIQN